MKTILLGTVVAVTLGLASQASAADLAARPYTKAPPMVAAAYDWSGFYIGVNGGWIGSDNNRFSNTGTDTGVGGLGTGLTAGYIPTTFGLQRSGGLIGGTAGYNLQVSPNWLFGLETDLDYVGARKAGTTGAITVAGFVPVTTNYSTRLDYLGTVRGRVGYIVAPSFMLFGTGGFAYGGAKLGSAFICPTCAPASGTEATTAVTSSKFMAGYAAGGGAEWMFAPNWTAKAEYLYADLGSMSNTIAYTYGAFSSTLTTTHRERDHIARVGINYKWGGPVVARY